MTIKKNFVELIKYLEDNQGKKVSTVLDEVKAMASAKNVEATVRYNDDGIPTHIFCYYHKQWEELASVPYGAKASTKSGFNTMCKIGVSKWTKMNKAIKAVDSVILDMLEKGELNASNVRATKDSMIEELRKIDMTDAPEASE